MKPKGKLLIIGGAEDKVGKPPYISEQMKEFTRYEILSELLPHEKKDRKIEIITTGSEVQEKVKKTYQKVFHEIGFSNLGFLPIKERIETRKKNYLTRVEEAAVIFFTGGDQFRLTTILGSTPIVDVIKRRYMEEYNFILAGTSAGAMAMSSVMITSGNLTEALIYRNLATSSGLGF